MGSRKSQKVWVVIPAAGIGKRMQSDIPKQYLKINGQTILEHTLKCFTSHPDIAGIVVVLQSDDDLWKTIHFNFEKQKMPLYTVEGGKERSDSVIQGLDYLLMVEQLVESSWVMVHDAARPCLLKEDIDALLLLRNETSVGGILASPVRDTMKRAVEDDNAGNKVILRTEKREDLWHALTPQLFKIGELKQALETCIEKGIKITDEASALEAVKKQVILVKGNSNNIKITQASDMDFAKLLLTSYAEVKA